MGFMHGANRHAAILFPERFDDDIAAALLLDSGVLDFHAVHKSPRMYKVLEKEGIVIKIELFDLVTSTTLESNKSLVLLPNTFDSGGICYQRPRTAKK